MPWRTALSDAFRWVRAASDANCYLTRGNLRCNRCGGLEVQGLRGGRTGCLSAAKRGGDGDWERWLALLETATRRHVLRDRF